MAESISGRALPTGTVTFLLTDVEGSSVLWERHPAEMAIAIERHDEIVVESVASHDGGMPVEQGEGDSHVAAFPSAMQAVTCALDIQRRLHRESWPEGVNLKVRMGLHTGETEYVGITYRGTAINRSARIREPAHGGQILLSSATLEALGEELPEGASISSLGLHRLRGLERPEEIFQVRHPDLPADFPPLRTATASATLLLPTQLVGRGRELESLRAVVDVAIGGAGQLYLLAGEPGIGKTSLAAELTTYAEHRGADVYWGRCYEGEGAPAFWPWVQVLRSLVDRHPQLEGELGPEVGSMISGEGGPDAPAPAPGSPPGEADSARFRQFRALTTLLTTTVSSRPVVIVLDDIHWADEPSLHLLEFLTRELRHARLCIVATYRDVELHRRHPLLLTLGELVRQPTTTRTTVRPLSETDVAAYIGAVAGFDPAPEFVSSVHMVSEGNPFYLGEILRLLSSEGVPESGTMDVATISVPPTVREVIGRRLSHLSGGCNRLLDVAAVIGRDFDFDLLTDVLGDPVDDVIDLLEEALGTGIVRELSGTMPRYQFVHALIHETLRGEISRSKRIRLHRTIGEALERLEPADRRARLSELAHHFYEAAPVGEATKAVRYAQAAGDQAMSLLAYEEAVRLYGMALDALELGDPSEGSDLRCDLLLARGEAENRSGDVEGGKASFTVAADIARSRGDAGRLARAALGFRGLGFEAGAVDATLVGLLEEALGALGSEDSVLRARVLGRLSEESYFMESPEPRLTLSEEAVEVARRCGDPRALASALSSRHFVLFQPENTGERLEIASEILRISTEIGDDEMTLTGHHWRLRDLLEIGDITGVERELEPIRRLVARLQQAFHDWQLKTFEAMLAILRGDFDVAESLILEAYELGEKAQSPNAFQGLGIQLFVLRWFQGRLSELEPVLREQVQQYPNVPAWRGGLSFVLAEIGDLTEAREEFESLASGDFSDLPWDGQWLITVAVLAETSLHLGDAARAGRLYDLLLPFEGLNVTIGDAVACGGSAAHYLGVLATTLGRWDDAERHFLASIAMDEGMGGRGFVVRTRYAYARMLLTRGGPGDGEEASKLLAVVVEDARALGMQRVLEQAEEARVGVS